MTMFSVKLGLQKLGSGHCMARQRRRIRQELMAERIGVTRATLKRMEQGLPAVSRVPMPRLFSYFARNVP